MSSFTEYVERVSAQYSGPQGVGAAGDSWEEGYVPLLVQQGFQQSKQELDRHDDAIVQARRRVRQEKVAELLAQKPQIDLLASVPYGTPLPLEDLVTQNRRVVLLGAPGAGKTTALRYLAAKHPVTRLQITEEGETVEQDLVPVMVNLPGLAWQPLPEYLSDDAEQRLSLTLSPSFFHEMLVDGRAVICADGLDEIVGQEARAKAVETIESWVEQYPLCHYVVTARPEGYSPALSGEMFTEHTLRPWNKGALADVEGAWNASLEAWTVEDADRTYYAQRARLWQHLALEMLRQDRLTVSVDEAKDWLVQAVQSDKQIRLNRRRAPGEIELLLQDGVPELGMIQDDNGWLRFTPRSLRDILAARALQTMCAENDPKAAWGEIEGRLGSADWQAAGKLLVQFLADDDPKLWSRFASLLLESGGEREPLYHTNLLLAATPLGGESQGLDRSTRRRVIDSVLEWLSDGEAAGREDAFAACYAMAGESYLVEKLADLAQNADANDWTRQAAVLLLGQVGSTRAADVVSALFATVDNAEDNEWIRIGAYSALGVMAAGDSLDEQLQTEVERGLLERGRNPDVPIGMRAAALEAVGMVLAATQDGVLIESLLELARAENGDEAKVPYSVQISAGQGLCRALAVKKDDDLMGRLWELSEDEEVDDSVRCTLAETLGTLDDVNRAGRVLIGLARSPKVYPPGQRDALEALGRLGSAEQDVVDQIVEISETKDRKTKDFVRLAASVTLGKLGQVTLSLQHLVMMIADKSIYRTTRNEALTYLGETGFSGDAALDDAVVSVLQIWVTEDNTTEDVRERAMESLRLLKVNRDDVVRDLVGVVQDRGVYSRVRRAVSGALMSLPVEDKEMVVEALSTTFYDPEEKSDLLRVPTAHLLYVWGNEEPALRYLKAAAEQSYMALVRYKAGIVLGELGEMEDAVTTLVKLAEAPEIADFIRTDAVRALGLWAIGNPEVAQLIQTLALDPEQPSNVRAMAYNSLRTMLAA